ncbi:hypothetical protein SAMN05877753_103232 [Bacillus oleivorans]|uniref:Uncharacterized protein n=1 Tax=Bacillus oleivorans TaxID=1448271 RepID=A0A285CS55_9BACI|nr:hypothetical protein SAMN05877753_103232 [Bacillus oleivorans]
MVQKIVTRASLQARCEYKKAGDEATCPECEKLVLFHSTDTKAGMFTIK